TAPETAPTPLAPRRPGTSARRAEESARRSRRRGACASSAPRCASRRCAIRWRRSTPARGTASPSAGRRSSPAASCRSAAAAAARRVVVQAVQKREQRGAAELAQRLRIFEDRLQGVALEENAALEIAEAVRRRARLVPDRRARLVQRALAADPRPPAEIDVFEI